VEHVAKTGKKRNAYKVFVEKPNGKKPLAVPYVYTAG
jgi:hypothetical protein